MVLSVEEEDRPELSIGEDRGGLETEAAATTEKAAGPERHGDRVTEVLIVTVEYAIVASLLVVSAIVLVRTVARFVTSTGAFPQSVVPAVDGILVVIILLDIVHTVFRHLRSATFPVRPFIVIAILSGVRDILSASAHLTLSTDLSTHQFDQTLIELGVGVGVVVVLLVGLYVLSRVKGRPLEE